MSGRKIAIILLLCATIVGLVFAFIASCTSPSPTPTPTVEQTMPRQLENAPKAVEPQSNLVDLSGKWTTKINETVFDVSVDDASITIKMTKSGQSILYWYGTFANSATVGETVVSNKLDINKAVLSSADAKPFVVQGKTLTFDVSAMGKTRTVEVGLV